MGPRLPVTGFCIPSTIRRGQWGEDHWVRAAAPSLPPLPLPPSPSSPPSPLHVGLKLCCCGCFRNGTKKHIKKCANARLATRRVRPCWDNNGGAGRSRPPEPLDHDVLPEGVHCDCPAPQVCENSPTLPATPSLYFIRVGACAAGRVTRPPKDFVLNG